MCGACVSVYIPMCSTSVVHIHAAHYIHMHRCIYMYTHVILGYKQNVNFLTFEHPLNVKVSSTHPVSSIFLHCSFIYSNMAKIPDN